ncbi:hypothetical protein DWY99_01290 [[Clostridium] leptum]|uniref:Uncharacterized protein n=1 Tax=[Clostridium] leptum TaxID=1535 RepID=A0A412B0W4_9FIRM|nr:hypothetical protein DWY99_01290 [[Clostridium] leptum]
MLEKVSEYPEKTSAVKKARALQARSSGTMACRACPVRLPAHTAGRQKSGGRRMVSTDGETMKLS